MSFGFTFAYMVLNMSNFSSSTEYFVQPQRVVKDHDHSSEFGHAKKNFGHAHNHEEMEEMEELIEGDVQLHDHKGK